MDSITKYFKLVSKPEMAHLFKQSKQLPLVLDEQEMREFSENTGEPIGLVFDNSPFYLVVADLIGTKGNYFRYSRVLYANVNNNGTFAIPCYKTKDETFFGLLTHYRHAPRDFFLEFPRGFCEPDLTPQENILKELSEELGITSEYLAQNCKISYLGSIRADTGLSAGKAECFLAEIQPDIEVTVELKEGITKYEWVSERTFQKLIAEGCITDGFTLSAYTLFNCRKKRE